MISCRLGCFCLCNIRFTFFRLEWIFFFLSSYIYGVCNFEGLGKGFILFRFLLLGWAFCYIHFFAACFLFIGVYGSLGLDFFTSGFGLGFFFLR